MSDRDYDVILYGATGFTGQYIARYLVKRLITEYKEDDVCTQNIRWAIAGRNETKLESLRNTLHAESESKEVEDLPIIIADVNDLGAMKKLAANARVIINATGPYRFFGENVVNACVSSSTHYVDICGEPEFMDKMALRYFDRAREKECIIVSACGFDSIPADIGTLFVERYYSDRGGMVNGIEAYHTISSGGRSDYVGHVTTFVAAVHGFGSVNELRGIRGQLKNKSWRDDRRAVSRVGPRQRVHKETYFWSNLMNRWSILFPFADSAVVSSGQGIRSALCRETHEKVDGEGVTQNGFDDSEKKVSKKGTNVYPYFAAYLTFPSKFYLFEALIMGAIGKLLCSFSWGRSLLLSFPSFFTFGAFSHDGPSREATSAASFQTDFFGTGFDRVVLDGETGDCNLNVHGRVTGPDPGYEGTSVMVVESALTLLADLEDIRAGNLEINAPPVQGGVFTPSVVFANTKLIDRLQENGVHFEIIEE